MSTFVKKTKKNIFRHKESKPAIENIDMNVNKVQLFTITSRAEAKMQKFILSYCAYIKQVYSNVQSFEFGKLLVIIGLSRI